MSIKIAPSLLTADLARLGEQVGEAVAAGADAIHVDVMDGRFVPNLTFGPLIVSALHPITRVAGVPLDVHLMVEKPEDLIPLYAQAGAGFLTVHVETCPHLHRTVQQIKELGVKAGVTLNPATSLASLEEILPEVDLVLVMSVNPGFGGQSYIPSSTAKIARLRQMLNARGLAHVELEVDGGVKVDNAAQIVAAGATMLVVGSAIFNSNASIAENMAVMRQALAR
ncbi:MAG TPA: ribulose-phosphate 3-epimerase [Anaerolineales bacterium]|nr:ribulose-phosphate 3-epimerase [Anaerolineales bacterium]